jgi:hypothetical protein
MSAMFPGVDTFDESGFGNMCLSSSDLSESFGVPHDCSHLAGYAAKGESGVVRCSSGFPKLGIV